MRLNELNQAKQDRFKTCLKIDVRVGVLAPNREPQIGDFWKCQIEIIRV